MLGMKRVSTVYAALPVLGGEGSFALRVAYLGWRTSRPRAGSAALVWRAICARGWPVFVSGVDRMAVLGAVGAYHFTECLNLVPLEVKGLHRWHGIKII
jgi:hypothetical protein